MFRHAWVWLVAGIAGCASGPGWQGKGARPFDAAMASCESKIAGIADINKRELARQQCMADQGWQRPR